MKASLHSIFGASLLLSATLFGCGGADKQTVQTDEAKTVDSAQTVAARELPIDTAASQVGWEGTEGLARITTTHTGSLAIKNGSLSVKDSQLVAGKFEIDINSLKNFDLENPKKNADLVGHLKGTDFFDAAKFPVATFELVSAEKMTADSTKITGNLTLKGVTKSVVFPAKVDAGGDKVTANAKFYINRKDWGMNWHSENSLGDEMIRPEVGIELKIATK